MNHYSFVTASNSSLNSSHYQNLHTEGSSYGVPQSPYYPYTSEFRNTTFHKSYDPAIHLISHQDPNRGNFMSKHESDGLHHYSSVPYPHNSWHEFDFGVNFPVPLQRGSKHKRPRMSLQKRLLVNARERERMRVLNKAFESLRDALPCYIADGHMAKITTLRLAINYIRALTDLLNEHKSSEKTKISSLTEEMNESKNLSPSYMSILSDQHNEDLKPLLNSIGERFGTTNGRTLDIQSQLQK